MPARQSDPCASAAVREVYHNPVKLPVDPPVLPMLAKRIEQLPEGDVWLFEPKWDGFRAVIFRDGDEVLIQSRDTKPLNRYFPELLDPLRAQLPARCVLDGEVVIAMNGGLDFEALQLRLSSLTCSAKATATCATIPSRLAGNNWSRYWSLPPRRFTSPPRPAT